MDLEKILPKEKLAYLYTQEKKSDQQIADQLHISMGQVHRLRRKYRIQTLEQYERHHIHELTNKEKSFIVGTLLGDCHSRKRRGKKTYPQLMFEQSIKHKDYVYWLKDQMINWVYNTDKPIKTNRKKHKKTGKYYHSLSFQTICHPVFEEFYRGFYRKGAKVLNLELLEKYFDDFAFAVWVMDDGCLSGNCKRNAIATNNFTFDEVNQLRDFLQQKYGLKSWVCKRTRELSITYELSFDKPSSQKMRTILNPHVISSMKYKLLHSETAKGAAKKQKVQSDTSSD